MIFLFNWVIFWFHAIILQGVAGLCLGLVALWLMFLFAAVWMTIFPILNDEQRVATVGGGHKDTNQVDQQGQGIWFIYSKGNAFTPDTLYLGGGFKDIFMFTPFRGRCPIWRAYVSDGLKPPTS